MQEKDLVELWNDKRRQIISAQMPSVIALAVITVVAMMGYFDGASMYAISFAAVFLVSVGSLSVLNQFAVIREAASIVNDLKALDNLSGVARILSDISWDIDSSERWVIVGPNGAGKTTLLALLASFSHPSSGTVVVLGETLGKTDVFELRPRVGFASSDMANPLHLWNAPSPRCMSSPPKGSR